MAQAALMLPSVKAISNTLSRCRTNFSAGALETVSNAADALLAVLVSHRPASLPSSTAV